MCPGWHSFWQNFVCCRKTTPRFKPTAQPSEALANLVSSHHPMITDLAWFHCKLSLGSFKPFASFSLMVQSHKSSPGRNIHWQSRPSTKWTGKWAAHFYRLRHRSCQDQYYFLNTFWKNLKGSSHKIRSAWKLYSKIGLGGEWDAGRFFKAL
jgi:hypothetical protein